MAISNRKIISAISCIFIFIFIVTITISAVKPKVDADRADYSVAFNTGGFIHSTAFDNYNKSYIVDLSRYNTVSDFSAIYNSGIDGVILRVGYRGYKTASFNIDEKFEEFYNSAKAAGLKVGAYFYGQPVSYDDSTEEAKFVLNAIKGKSFELPIAYDIEYASNSSGLTGRLYEANLSKASLTAICNNFCLLLNNNGYSTMVYTNADILTNHMISSLLISPVWLARYNSYVDYDCTYTMWQFTSKGSVNGVSGNVDVSVLYELSSSTDDTATSSTDTLDTTVTEAPIDTDGSSTATDTTSAFAELLTALMNLLMKLIQALPSLLAALMG